jgi:hypothetical protein
MWARASRSASYGADISGNRDRGTGDYQYSEASIIVITLAVAKA